MAKSFLVPINLNQLELQNAVIQQLASAPGSPVQGQIYYNTGDDNLYIWDGAAWVDLTATGTGDVVGPGSAVDSQVVLFDSTTGKLVKASTLSANVVKSTSGVLSAAAIVLGDFAANVIDTDSTMAADSDSRLATQKATKAAIAAAVTGLLDFKGATDCSTNPNYPAASKGDAYVVSVAGKIGGASGKSVEVGDMYIATADNAGGTEASVGTSWTVLEHNLVGALLSANNLSDVGNTATAFDNIKQASTTTYVGAVELATTAETQARADTTRAVTAASLADTPRKYTETIGDGVATAIAVTHSLGTKDVVCQARLASSDAVVECDIVNTSTTQTTFTFGVAPASSAIKVVIVG